MILADAARCQLLLVDFQVRLLPAIEAGAEVLANAVRLAEAAKALGLPIAITEQNPRGLGPSVPEIAGRGPVFEKLAFGAGAEPDFLAGLARPDLVVAGCEAHVCVLQTVAGLLAAGRRVFLVRDALGARRAESKETAIARMAAAGAQVVTTEMMVFEWLGRSDHAQFRALSKLIR